MSLSDILRFEVTQEFLARRYAVPVERLDTAPLAEDTVFPDHDKNRTGQSRLRKLLWKFSDGRRDDGLIGPGGA